MTNGEGTVTLNGVELLAEHLLIATGPVDHGAWNYRPVLGWQQRQRFRMIRKLMGDHRFGDLLEIGYGSGVFAPELVKHCDRYTGIDIHGKNAEVAEVLDSVGIASDLLVGSASAMPFEDNSVDCVVAASVLEFVDDIMATCQEIARVLHPKGRAYVTITGDSPILDLGLKIATGESADEDFAERRSHLEDAVRKNFLVDRVVGFPRVSMLGIRVYEAFDLRVPRG
jgi:SAM-dependent methyltransferase